MGEDAAHRRSIETQRDLHQRPRRGGKLQPVACRASHRPYTAPDGRRRPLHSCARSHPRCRHAAAALPPRRLPRRLPWQGLPPGARRRVLVVDPGRVCRQHDLPRGARAVRRRRRLAVQRLPPPPLADGGVAVAAVREGSRDGAAHRRADRGSRRRRHKRADVALAAEAVATRRRLHPPAPPLYRAGALLGSGRALAAAAARPHRPARKRVAADRPLAARGAD
mmetsp:Transcript_14941/g.47982  ORF Transcript_14941/g.47982 Transcript_14941/m.47982 type:complete len:223 (-) Transcript_14941:697-1365(-)